MTNDEFLKEIIRNQEPNFLERDKLGKSYICPFCGNGGGKRGDGLSRKGVVWKCFSCGNGGDTYALYGIKHGYLSEGYSQANMTAQFPKIFKELKSYYGYENATEREVKTMIKQVEEKKMAEAQEIIRPIMTEYYETCKKNLQPRTYPMHYLIDRGITNERLIRHFNIGYDANAYGGSLIIPLNDYSYINALLDDNMRAKYGKYRFNKGAAGLFNIGEITSENAKPIFVVEGVIDALSIIEVGGRAVALCSTSGARKFIEAVKSAQASNTLTTAQFVLAMDNDGAEGARANNLLARELRTLGVKHHKTDLIKLYGEGIKDANEALTTDRTAFEANVKTYSNDLALGLLEAERLEQEQGVTAEVIDDNGAIIERPNSLTVIKNNGFNPFKTEQFESTGINSFDKALGGGIAEASLMMIAAAPGAGKTSLVLQIMYNLAKHHNRPAIFFSYDMSAERCIRRGLFREAYRRDRSFYGVKTKEQIESDNQLKSVWAAAEQEYFFEVGDKIIFALPADSTPRSIRAEIERLIAYNKHTNHESKPPLICIDYLQQMLASDEKQNGTSKDRMDGVIREIKEIIKEFKTPFIVVNSSNRANYRGEMGLETFKESGEIEFSADVCITMQPAKEPQLEVSEVLSKGATVGDDFEAENKKGNVDISEFVDKKLSLVFKDSRPDKYGNKQVLFKVVKNRYGDLTDDNLLYFNGEKGFFDESVATAEEYQELIDTAKIFQSRK